MQKPKILFVDDEQNILSSFERNLQSRYDIFTALGPAEGLQALQDHGPFAIVISDYKMPKMNGNQFLAHVKSLSPNSVRIMLTGQADLNASIDAVNKGHVFRFLTKPCSLETIVLTINDAWRLYRMATAEKELLQGTLSGSIKVLTDLISLISPEAFGRSENIKRHILSMCEANDTKNTWQFELAAMLSQIGCLTIDQNIVHKKYHGQSLSKKEEDAFKVHPYVAANLLSNIPRMEAVNDMIRDQLTDFEKKPGAHTGAHMLKIANDYENLAALGHDPENAILTMRKTPECYDPRLLAILEENVSLKTKFSYKDVTLIHLKEGMILTDDITTKNNVLLVTKGQEINQAIILKLHSFDGTHGVKQPVSVKIPIEN